MDATRIQRVGDTVQRRHASGLDGAVRNEQPRGRAVMEEAVSYFDVAAFAQKGRVAQARALAEWVRPYADRSPDQLGPYVESIRRFGAGEFVPQAELTIAAARISVALQLINAVQQGDMPLPEDGVSLPPSEKRRLRPAWRERGA